jgi:hypothetical protein
MLVLRPWCTAEKLNCFPNRIVHICLSEWYWALLKVLVCLDTDALKDEKNKQLEVISNILSRK